MESLRSESYVVNQAFLYDCTLLTMYTALVSPITMTLELYTTLRNIGSVNFAENGSIRMVLARTEYHAPAHARH